MPGMVVQIGLPKARLHEPAREDLFRERTTALVCEGVLTSVLASLRSEAARAVSGATSTTSFEVAVKTIDRFCPGFGRGGRPKSDGTRLVERQRTSEIRCSSQPSQCACWSSS